jgi:protein gp37
MGGDSAIEWTDHTFNPWWGCVEISPACDHCYAREWAKFRGHQVWGKHAPRRFFGDRHWDEPFRWHRRAEKVGVHARVFCASMADVLERRDDLIGRQLDQARFRLWSTIANTPALDWLLLTKRPQEYSKLVPPKILALPNVWLGTTVERQDYEWRLEKLLAVPGAGPRWISAEPLLGPLDLTKWFCSAETKRTRGAISWVIVGGESGPGSRPGPVSWVRGIVAQCKAAHVACFVKQLGAYVIDRNDAGFDGETPGAWPMETRTEPRTDQGWQGDPIRVRLRDRKGADPVEWPEDLRVRECSR